ncbi:phosphoenolpyruvate synthase / Pyruvate phosphate dikinase [Candidatus Pelagibacter sp. IMCC9063]|nr:phosphoenolpyruvate synthase / Pyruvate phosphate dikinase [Candidatus Pelagibacter sp. IMCC9063]
MFFKKSIELREYSKFVFTKSIDQIFQNLKKFGKRNRIKVDDLSYLTIQNIIDIYYNLEYKSINRNLSDKISNNKQNYIELSNINLPEVIIEKNDIYYFEEKNTKVNFVGTDKASGKVLHLRKMHKTTNLSKKIICIENADPGYDFLFSKNISGLITKYGGANSHMAIRCYELGIPAAIGVGNYLFEDIIKKKFIDINCEIKKIF